MGTDAEITYRATQAGPHYLVVASVRGFDTGGYLLFVGEAPSTANPVIIPPSYETVDSPFGPMTVFVSADSGISLHFPAEWFPGEESENAEFAFGDTAGNQLTAISAVIEESDPTVTNLEEFADALVSVLKSQFGPAGPLVRVNVQTAQGFDAVRFEWDIFDGLLRQNHLIIMDEQGNHPCRSSTWKRV